MRYGHRWRASGGIGRLETTAKIAQIDLAVRAG